MRPTTISQTGAGSTAAIPLDIYGQFNVGIACVVDGTVNYDVQLTWDDVQNPAVTPTWFDDAALAGETTSQYGGITTPCRAVRLTVNSGAGTVTMTVIQEG